MMIRSCDVATVVAVAATTITVIPTFIIAASPPPPPQTLPSLTLAIPQPSLLSPSEDPSNFVA